MKNLSKVLAVVLAFAMALSMVSFAAYTDVEAGADCEEAVTVLSALGILSGYQDGTFKPEATITRAEFASVVVRMLGYGDIAGGGSVVFTDVPADHWANGVIALAASQGIISGYGDGRFGPEDPVNYEQAIAMVVRALGYTPMADANGGYPGGYQIVAAGRGILAGTAGAPGVPANRGTVAQFVYNSLTVPMMEQTSYGSETEYKPVKKLILNSHGITKLEGNVFNTSASSDKVETGKVEVKYTAQISAPTNNEAFAVKYETSSTYAYPKVANVNSGTAVTLKVSAAVEEDAKNLMDMASIMYVKNAENAKSAELVCIMADDNKNATVEFTSEDVAVTSTMDNDSKDSVDEIKIYTDKEAGEYEEYEVALTKIYVNDRTAGTAGKLYEEFNKYIVKGKENVDIKLLAASDDEDLFTVAYITEWNDVVVDSVSERSWRVYTNGATLELDETDKDAKFVIYKDGEVASFADIKENDVLSYYGKLSMGESKPYGVVHIVSDKVEGKVTGTAAGTVIVDGVEYKATSTVVSALAGKLGDSYTFYKNARGVIIDEDKTETKSNLKYGFASYIFNDKDMETSSVKLLTADGVWATINFPAKFVVDGARQDSTIDWTTVAGYSPETSGSKKYVANEVVAYELNANGEIAKLYTKDVADTFKADNLDTPSDKTDKASNYVATTGRLGGYEVDDNTVIFNIVKSTADLSKALGEKDVTVVAVSTLLDRTPYNVMAGYNQDEDTGLWAALYGFEIEADINWASDFFVVSSDPVQTTNEEGDTGYLFKGLQAGEEKTLFINTDIANGIAASDLLKVTAYSNNANAAVDATTANLSVSAIAKGDILIYGLNAAGEAAKVIRLVDVSTLYGSENAFGKLDDVLSTGKSSVLSTFKVGDTEYKFVFGYAMDRKDSKIALVNKGDDAAGAEEYRFAANLLGAAYDKAIGETGKVTEAAYGDISLDKNYGTAKAEKSGDFVFARVTNSYTIEDFAVIRNLDLD